MRRVFNTVIQYIKRQRLTIVIALLTTAIVYQQYTIATLKSNLTNIEVATTLNADKIQTIGHGTDKAFEAITSLTAEGARVAYWNSRYTLLLLNGTILSSSEVEEQRVQLERYRTNADNLNQLMTLAN